MLVVSVDFGVGVGVKEGVWVDVNKLVGLLVSGGSVKVEIEMLGEVDIDGLVLLGIQGVGVDTQGLGNIDIGRFVLLWQIGVDIQAAAEVDVDYFVFLLGSSGVEVEIETLRNIDNDGLVLPGKFRVDVGAAVEINVDEFATLLLGVDVQIQALLDVDISWFTLRQQIGIYIQTLAELHSNRVPSSRRIGVDIDDAVDWGCKGGRVQGVEGRCDGIGISVGVDVGVDAGGGAEGDSGKGEEKGGLMHNRLLFVGGRVGE